MISGVIMIVISFCETSIDKQIDSNYLGIFLMGKVREIYRRKGRRRKMRGDIPARIHEKKRLNIKSYTVLTHQR